MTKETIYESKQVQIRVEASPEVQNEIIEEINEIKENLEEARKYGDMRRRNKYMLAIGKSIEQIDAILSFDMSSDAIVKDHADTKYERKIHDKNMNKKWRETVNA